METLVSISSLVMSKLFVETFWVGKEKENVLFVHSAAILLCNLWALQIQAESSSFISINTLA